MAPAEASEVLTPIDQRWPSSQAVAEMRSADDDGDVSGAVRNLDGRFSDQMEAISLQPKVGGRCPDHADERRAEINGASPDERLVLRREQSAPIIAELELWLDESRWQLTSSQAIVKAINYLEVSGVLTPTFRHAP